MKKLFFGILGLILTLSIVSCKNKDSDKIILEGKYEITEPIDLTHDELADKLAYETSDGEKVEGDDFVLYVYTNGCSSCAAFRKNVLLPLIEEESVVIYSIEYTRIQDLFKTPSKYSSNPRIVIFKAGEVYTQANSSSNSEAFASKEGFVSYMEKYVVMPTLIELNYTQLLAKLANKEEMIVYYGWKVCGDCQYLESHYLKEFLEDHENGKNWYYFEVSNFRQYKTSDGNGENESIWNDFIELTQININSNRGKIPTIAYYKDGVRTDYVVYFNDNLSYDETAKTYTVVRTAYDDPDISVPATSEIVGLTFDSYVEYQEGVESFHTAKFVDFMKKHYTD